jgi:hypothetical protein
MRYELQPYVHLVWAVLSILVFLWVLVGVLSYRWGAW